ncbi:MAG: 3-aminobutyryl-CoA ammonia lyase [Candidatus Izimaplasma sp.]|nr:3-aminobutyryl-CoA ammonia lyase [Candidatus Izimaplasma bacterium]
MEKVLIRMRLSAHHAHYGGGLVDGAFITQIFGDVATELLIINDGDEGLFRAYNNIEFLAPLYAGDYIEVTGWITKTGNTSRQMEFEAYKVIEALPSISPSAAKVLTKKVLVAKATGTCIVPKELQRY